MKKFALFLITFACILSSTVAQIDLSYYLPDSVTYNPAIPTPKSIIGHEVGELAR